MEKLRKYKPVPKVQSAFNWGALTTVSLGVFAAAYPEVYDRLPPTFEGALVLLASSTAGYMKVDRT